MSQAAPALAENPQADTQATANQTHAEIAACHEPLDFQLFQEGTSPLVHNIGFISRDDIATPAQDWVGYNNYNEASMRGFSHNSQGTTTLVPENIGFRITQLSSGRDYLGSDSGRIHNSRSSNW